MRLFRHATAIVTPAFQLAPVRPDLRSGLRAALMTVGPLVASAVLGRPPLAWMSLAGFITCVTDKGGAYQTRAITTGAITFVGTIAVAVAAMAGQHLTWAMPLMFLFGLGGGLARVYGTEATVVGSQVGVVFAASLATPVATVHEAVSRGMSFFTGGVLAMGLSLLFWPIRYYAPVRRVVAECYRELAIYAGALAELSTQPDDGGWAGLSRVAHHKIRETIEATRSTIVAARRGRQGESGRGVRLLLLLEQMERLFTLLASMGDQLDSLGPQPEITAFRAHCHRLLQSLRIEVETIERLIETESGAPTYASGWDPATLAAEKTEAAGRTALQQEHVVALFEQVRLELATAIELANGLEKGGPLKSVPRSTTPVDAGWTTQIIAPLAANLNRHSLVFRHAARVGVLASLAVGLTHWLKLPMGHWVTLTLIVILQPYLGATTLKGVQRAVGTVLGGVIAALLAATVKDPHWVLVLVFVFTTISVSLLPLNYGLFSMLLTPTFVLLTEMRIGNWHLASVRITNSLIGAGIAFAGSLLLWPSPERRRLPAEMAAALRGIRLYVRAITDFLLSPSPASREALTKAQRATGLALINAEASFQRLLTEATEHAAESERHMTTLIHARRLVSSLTALASLQEHVTTAAAPQLVEFAEHLEAVLERASDQIAHGGGAEAGAMEVSAPAAHDEVLQGQLDRVAQRVTDLMRQLRVVDRSSKGWPIASQRDAPR